MKACYDERIGWSFKPDCVKECLDMIVDIGYDYDGYTTVEGLMSLVNELVDYAKEAINFLNEGKISNE